MKKEELYQQAVVQYLDLLMKQHPGWWYTANRSEGYQTGKQLGLKKTMGVRPGMPDIFVCIPPQAFFIEMKTEETTLTREQPRVFPIIQECGIPIFVCKTPKEAIDTIDRIRRM